MFSLLIAWLKVFQMYYSPVSRVISLFHNRYTVRIWCSLSSTGHRSHSPKDPVILSRWHCPPQSNTGHLPLLLILSSPHHCPQGSMSTFSSKYIPNFAPSTPMHYHHGSSRLLQQISLHLPVPWEYSQLSSQMVLLKCKSGDIYPFSSQPPYPLL